MRSCPKPATTARQTTETSLVVLPLGSLTIPSLSVFPTCGCRQYGTNVNNAHCIPSQLLTQRIRNYFMPFGVVHYTVHARVLSHFSHVQLFVAPWTIAHQSPVSMEFSQQEYWSGLPFPPSGNLLDPGIVFLMSSALAGGFFTTSAAWEAVIVQ